MKPTTCLAREKKMRHEKRKKKGGEKAILLSAHARTSQADILNLEQKAAKCTTCKLVCGKL